MLLNAELAGATIAAKKSQWCQKEAVLLGYLCTEKGRLPYPQKVVKICEWTTCENVSHVRTFMGMVGYYRIWIKGFALIAIPLYGLMKKEVEWKWGEDEQAAMDRLRGMITTAPVLATLVFGDERYGIVYLMVDASLEGWGGVIEQVGPDGKRHPCRFESGIWSAAEKRYDATKRELRGLLYVLKRFRRYLFGVHFIIETDALVLVHQLKGAASDVPGALIMRWIAWIRLFDFDIKHIPGPKNLVADALSRKPPGPTDKAEKNAEEDIDDWVDAQIYTNTIFTQPMDDRGTLAEGVYSDYSRAIARYVATLREPTHIEPWRRRQFKKEALKYFVEHGHLFLRALSGGGRRVVDFPQDRRKVFNACHREAGHRGREATYQRVTNHYYWKGMYANVAEWIRACPECQAHDAKRFEEVAGWTHPSPQPMAKWHLDIQYMPSVQSGKKCFLIEARDDLTGFVEASILPDKSSASVRRFLQNDIFLRWGLPLCIVVDGGSEFKGEVKSILWQLKVQRVVISPYNSRANGINEQGHIPIATSLAKYTNGTGKYWRDFLPYVLHADRTTVRGPLQGRSPFSMIHNYEPISPIENDVPSWRIIAWDSVCSEQSDEGKKKARQQLLLLRARVLWDAEHDFEIMAERVAAAREKSAQRRNDKNQRRFRAKDAQVNVGDLVLVYNTLRTIDMSSVRKLEFRWEGPYRVRKIKDRGTYFLRTLDGDDILTPYPPNRIKKFFKLDDVWIEADGESITPQVVSDHKPDKEEEGQGGPEEGSDGGLRRTRSQTKRALEEREVPQETAGRANGEDAEKVRSKGKWKQELVVELPRGKPEGW